MFEVLIVRKPERPEDTHAVRSWMVPAATAKAAAGGRVHRTAGREGHLRAAHRILGERDRLTEARLALLYAQGYDTVIDSGQDVVDPVA